MITVAHECALEAFGSIENVWKHQTICDVKEKLADTRHQQVKMDYEVELKRNQLIWLRAYLTQAADCTMNWLRQKIFLLEWKIYEMRKRGKRAAPTLDRDALRQCLMDSKQGQQLFTESDDKLINEVSLFLESMSSEIFKKTSSHHRQPPRSTPSLSHITTTPPF